MAALGIGWKQKHPSRRWLTRWLRQILRRAYLIKFGTQSPNLTTLDGKSFDHWHARTGGRVPAAHESGDLEVFFSNTILFSVEKYTALSRGLNVDKKGKDVNPHWMSRAVRHPLTVALYYFSIIAVAIVLDRYSDLVSREAILFSAFGAFILFVTIFGLTALSFRLVRAEEINERIQDLQNFFANQQMGWIVNDKYIKGIEAESTETWVFTRNLVNDLDTEGHIFQSVKGNLKAGKKYKYFVPDNPTSHQTISDYEAVHSFEDDQVDFYLIPSHHFHFYTEVVAYNVDNSNHQMRSAIEWLPIHQVETGKENSQFYILMDTQQVKHVLGIGRMFIKRFPPKKNDFESDA